MHIVHVHVHVKPEFVDDFLAATLENARNSVLEPGVTRFDVVQQADDPTRFVLVEVYRSAEDAARHKETAHYPVWRDRVAEMMAEPRVGVKYTSVFPAPTGWIKVMAAASQFPPRFEFNGPDRIIFGRGALAEVGALAAAMGRRALLVVGSEALHAGRAGDYLRASGIDYVNFSVPGEPTVELARQGVTLARDAGCDLVIGLGGGSALDAGKAIAALLGNGGDPLDYLEVVGLGRALDRPSAPYIAIPTTAGTGSEATRNAVLMSPEHGVKASLRSAHMLPRVALADPELTYTVPPGVTASTGLDALTQLIEPFVSVRANPLTDALCRDGIPRVIRSLQVAYDDGSNAAAREDMAFASLLGGLALGNAGLGAVHGFAGVIGGMFPAPHGAVCAALLPHVTAVNLNALRGRAPEDPALARYAELAELLTDGMETDPDSAVAFLREIVLALGIPGLGAYGMSRDDVETIVARTKAASSTKANPIGLTDAELTEVLERAL